ncbi:TPA: hypothetical protein STX52_000108 [Clostridioides difficile]|nr:hypothetical protein [Clostridioides difficile]
MLIQEKSFYPNDIYPKIDFLKIKRQLKSIYKNDLSDCGSICIIEKEHYSISVNSIGEVNIYYDSKLKQCAQKETIGNIAYVNARIVAMKNG